MPNRILKESICQSDTLSTLTWFEEVVFYRLIVNCDDYGRFDGRPAILKNRLFPLCEGLSLAQVSEAVNQLANAGLLTLYHSEGKPYLYLNSWHEHQNIRAHRSKYPTPPESICKQLHAAAPEIQSESESQSQTGKRAGDGGAPVVALPLNDGSECPIFQSQADEWAKLYQSVDVCAELRKMRGWLMENPARRKTARGVGPFIVGWLGRQQDHASAPRAPRRMQEHNYTQRAPDPSWDDIPEEQLEAMRRLDERGA